MVDAVSMSSYYDRRKARGIKAMGVWANDEDARQIKMLSALMGMSLGQLFIYLVREHISREGMIKRANAK